jgi:hypothetical protein
LYNFDLHSYGTSPRPKRSIILINKERINFVIRINLEGPFKIVKTEPMEATVGNMLFNIIPNSNLKLDIKYLCPEPSDEKAWPMTLVNEYFGKLTVAFENNEFQEYDLRATLRRPRILLSTSGNDATESQKFVDFGLVNCESNKKITLYLSNETEVLTKWTINYVKHVPKKNYGYGTTTLEEKEDITKTDDSDVFVFNVTEGLIYGPTDSLINIPLGPALPKVPNKIDEKFKPIKIDIMFKVNCN